MTPHYLLLPGYFCYCCVLILYLLALLYFRYRDPTLAVHRTEITRFPHAVLEVKLSLPEGQSAPPWVQDMLDSGYLTEVGRCVTTRVMCDQKNEVYRKARQV
jgi:hypothetical protein